jgi:hypothetical protein
MSLPPTQFDPINPRAPFIWHGGDYNPEQWPPETWDTDMALMQQSRFNVATVGVFSWVSLQPEEDRFTFEWLDTIFEKLHASGRAVCLATPSAAQPAWMSQRYDVPPPERAGSEYHSARVNFSLAQLPAAGGEYATRPAERWQAPGAADLACGKRVRRRLLLRNLRGGLSRGSSKYASRAECAGGRRFVTYTDWQRIELPPPTASA